MTKLILISTLTIFLSACSVLSDIKESWINPTEQEKTDAMINAPVWGLYK